MPSSRGTRGWTRFAAAVNSEASSRWRKRATVTPPQPSPLRAGRRSWVRQTRRSNGLSQLDAFHTHVHEWPFDSAQGKRSNRLVPWVFGDHVIQIVTRNRRERG